MLWVLVRICDGLSTNKCMSTDRICHGLSTSKLCDVLSMNSSMFIQGEFATVKFKKD